MSRAPISSCHRRLAACGFALLYCAWALAPSSGASQSTRPKSNGKTVIARAVEQLTEEAERARKDLRLIRDEPNFARHFAETIPDDELLIGLTRRTNPEPFIDAFVRWQLTSCNFRLPELDDRDFFKMMGNAPPLLENPRANEETVAIFEKAEKAERLSDRDLERLQETWRDLQVRSATVESLNAPALGWRKWVDDQLPERGPRKIQWLIERCAALTPMGWPSRTAKGDMTRMCRSAGTISGEAALTPPQKQMIADQMQRLAGIRRRTIEDVAFLANGKVDVTFANLYIEDKDVQKWIALLNGEDAPQ